MAEVYGDFVESQSGERLTLSFSPSEDSLKERWQNNALSADFIAEYFTTFFAYKNEHVTQEIIENTRDTVKYIANELLENAMKFQSDSEGARAKIVFSLDGDRLIFNSTNNAKPDRVDSYKNFVVKLLEQDPNDLYLEVMRSNALDEGSNRSGLGLLSMVCDYSAQLGWSFGIDKAGAPIVTTAVVLNTQEEAKSMEIKEDKYQIYYDADTAIVTCQGSLMLNGPKEYEPILNLLKTAAEDQAENLTVDVRQLKFLNSSGINMMTKFVIYVCDIKQLSIQLSMAIVEKVAWQQKLAKNMKRLMPELEIDAA